MQGCVFGLELIGSLLQRACELISRTELLLELLTGLRHLRQCLVKLSLLLLQCRNIGLFVLECLATLLVHAGLHLRNLSLQLFDLLLTVRLLSLELGLELGALDFHTLDLIFKLTD